MSTRDQALALLTTDVEEFNQWRGENPGEELDFSGEDFRALEMGGAYLMGVKLDGANFSHAILCRALFCKASCKGANFENSDLTGASFGPPELIEASFSQSELGSMLSHGADCSGANFTWATITDTQFRECDVSDANFSHANHNEANFANAQTDGAQFPDENATLEERVWGSLAQLTFPQKKSYVLSLYAIAAFDGEISDEEIALLFDLAKKMELSEEEFEACLPSGESFALEDIPFDVPDDDNLRAQWLRNLIMMVAADGVLANAEHEVCLYLASQLGFQPIVVDQILSALGSR